MKYEFLKCLEITKCVSSDQGWQPLHAIVTEKEKVIAVMPLYIKTDSQGEFIFDWSWADAYYRNGLEYYPKLVSSIPFTPATGPRILFSNNSKKEVIVNKISESLKKLSEDQKFSSVHILLAEKEEINQFSQEDFSLRTSYSFHWFNNNYRNFDMFLEDMTSRQRKNIKKERGKILQQDVTLSRIKGSEITVEMMEIFYQFYQVTYLKRGMRGYLNFDFFKTIIQVIPESIMLVLAENKSGNFVAGGDITAFGTVSDRNRKENIVKIENALDKVSQISGYTFNYIGDDTPMTGVIAQELEEVLPEVVYETEALDGTQSKAVRHGNIVGLLIESIKELKAEIEELKKDK